MGSTIRVERRPSVRVLGALVAALVGSAFVGLVIAFPAGGNAASIAVFAALSMALSVPLGWFFAPRALAPGRTAWLTTASSITAIAIPLGALLVALFLAAGARDPSPGELVFGVAFLLIAGLIMFGLPLALLTFGVAIIWIGLLRLLSRTLLNIDEALLAETSQPDRSKTDL